jgi:hypothetical protein
MFHNLSLLKLKLLQNRIVKMFLKCFKCMMSAWSADFFSPNLKCSSSWKQNHDCPNVPGSNVWEQLVQQLIGQRHWNHHITNWCQALWEICHWVGFKTSCSLSTASGLRLNIPCNCLSQVSRISMSCLTPTKLIAHTPFSSQSWSGLQVSSLMWSTKIGDQIIKSNSQLEASCFTHLSSPMGLQVQMGLKNYGTIAELANSHHSHWGLRKYTNRLGGVDFSENSTLS